MRDIVPTVSNSPNLQTILLNKNDSLFKGSNQKLLGDMQMTTNLERNRAHQVMSGDPQRGLATNVTNGIKF